MTRESVPNDPNISPSVRAMMNLGGAQAKDFAANQISSIDNNAVALGKSQVDAARNFAESQPMMKANLPDIRMQHGKEDDKDPNKERMEHEMRLARRNEEGKYSYMPKFLMAAEQIGLIENDTRDLDQMIFKVRLLRNKIEQSTDWVEVEASPSLQDARDTLKTEQEELRKAVDDKKAKNEKVMIKGSKGGDDWDAVESGDKFAAEVADYLIEEPNEREKRLEGARERAAEAYENIIQTTMDELGGLNRYLEHLKNPYPYDSRYAMQYFEQALEQVTDKLRNTDRAKNPETTALLKMLKRDMLWANANARVVEGMGPAFELYFDGELMLQWIRSPHTELVAQDFIRLYKDKLRGADLTDEQRELVKKTLSKRPDRLIRQSRDENGNPVERLGMREVAVEQQDASIKWLYKAVAVGQKNLDLLDGGSWTENDADKEEGERYAVVENIETFMFLQEVMAMETVNADGTVSEVGEFQYKAADGTMITVKEKILNPFCMPRNDELAIRAFESRMQQLVLNASYYEQKMEEIMAVGNPAVRLVRIKALASELKDRAAQRSEQWEALDDTESPYARLAEQVIKSTINIEKGVLSGGDLGWTWNYEEVKKKPILTETGTGEEYVILGGGKTYKQKTDEVIWRALASNPNFKVVVDPANGDEYVEQRVYKKNVSEGEWKEITGEGKTAAELGVKRKSEMGSIYENHDVTTVVYLARHMIDYDIMAETRGSGILVFPTIGEYRDKWLEQPPYWRPKVEVIAKNDPELLKRLGIGSDGKITASGGILSENNPLEKMVARKVYMKGKDGIQEQYYGKFDTRVRDFIYNNMWSYMTPFLAEPGNPKSDYLTMPMFMPTSLPLGFWRSMTLDSPSARTVDGRSVSVWHRRLRGERNSKLNWENMDRYKYSYIRVSHDQMERWLGPIVTPHEFNRSTQPEYEKHFLGEPSGTADKELGKRGRLGGRIFNWSDGVLRASSFAQNKMLAAIKGAGLMGKSPTPTEVDKLFASFQRQDVAKWINVLLDMPSKVRKVQNYPGTAAQVALLTALQGERIVRSVIKHGTDQVDSVSAAISNVKKSF